jgi:hypothetical protein
MIRAAETACDFVTGRTRSDLDTDQMLVFALVWKTATEELPELLPK